MTWRGKQVTPNDSVISQRLLSVFNESITMCGVVKPLRVEPGLMHSVYWCEPGMDGPAMMTGDGWP